MSVISQLSHQYEPFMSAWVSCCKLGSRSMENSENIKSSVKLTYVRHTDNLGRWYSMDACISLIVTGNFIVLGGIWSRQPFAYSTCPHLVRPK